MVKLLKKYVENGKLIAKLPSEKSIREYIQTQRTSLEEL
jgi:hypothetical protein